MEILTEDEVAAVVGCGSGAMMLIASASPVATVDVIGTTTPPPPK